jgi:hypothetical protein
MLSGRQGALPFATGTAWQKNPHVKAENNPAVADLSPPIDRALEISEPRVKAPLAMRIELFGLSAVGAGGW